MPFYEIPEPFTVTNPHTGEVYKERGYDAEFSLHKPGAHGSNLRNDLAHLMVNQPHIARVDFKFLTYVLRTRIKPRTSGKFGDLTPVLTDAQVEWLEEIVRLHKAITKAQENVA